MLFPSLLSFILLSHLAYGHRHGRRAPGVLDLLNDHNLQYSTNITIAGQSFQVVIDTTSSDLWVVSDALSGAKFKNEYMALNSLPGSASGPAMSAPVEFGGGSIADQAFVLVSPNATDVPAGRGLLGVGPSNSSGILSFFNSTGNTVMDNLFMANTLADPFITILLGRLDGPSANLSGDLTIAQTVTGLDAITSQPKLPVTPTAFAQFIGQRFQILLDDNGFIGPDGKAIPIPFNSSITNSSRPTAVVDTRDPFSQVPPSVAHALYSQYGDDAKLSANDSEVDGDVWVVACDVEVNVTLVFGGEAYPVHPLDATLDPAILGLAPRTLPSGKKGCLGSFQPLDLADLPIFDLVLAQPFLRSAYSLFYYGNLIQGPSFANKPAPYVQFLSTVNGAQAHQDFVAKRLNGTSSGSGTVSSQLDLAASSDSNSNSHDGGLPWNKAKIIIIALGATAGVLLIAFIAAVVAWWRAKERAAERGAYRTLDLPAPGQLQQHDKAYSDHE